MTQGKDQNMEWYVRFLPGGEIAVTSFATPDLSCVIEKSLQPSQTEDTDLRTRTAFALATFLSSGDILPEIQGGTRLDYNRIRFATGVSMHVRCDGDCAVIPYAVCPGVALTDAIWRGERFYGT